jgi:hypothetical protein
MSIVDRAKQISLQPKAAWRVIDAEPHTPQSLFVPYMLILAAIPAVAGFIGMSVLGFGGFGLSMRLPIFNGLTIMVTTYVMTLVMTFAMGWLVSTLAPTFGGRSDLISGLKIAVFGSTPMLLAGVLNLIPALGVLGLLVAIYSLYVIYLGLPVLMKNPKEKTVVYLIVLIVAGIVAAVLLSVVTNMFNPMRSGMHVGAMESGGGTASISTPMGDIKFDTSRAAGTASAPDNTVMTIKTPDGEIKVDAQKMEEFAKQMGAVAAQLEKEKK